MSGQADGSGSQGTGSDVGSWIGAGTTALDTILKVVGAFQADTAVAGQGSAARQTLQEQMAQYQAQASRSDRLERALAAKESSGSLKAMGNQLAAQQHGGQQQKVQNALLAGAMVKNPYSEGVAQ